MHDLLEVAHQFERLLRRLAEPGARIDADAVAGDAGFLKTGGAAAQPIAHLGDHVVVGGGVLHRRRLALHVHDHHAAIARDRDIDHRGVGEPGHIVDDGRARLQARAGHVGMARVDADADALGGERAHDVDHAGKLLLGAHRRGARPG